MNVQSAVRYLPAVAFAIVLPLAAAAAAEIKVMSSAGGIDPASSAATK